jgi:hypothetical protein
MGKTVQWRSRTLRIERLTPDGSCSSIYFIVSLDILLCSACEVDFISIYLHCTLYPSKDELGYSMSSQWYTQTYLQISGRRKRQDYVQLLLSNLSALFIEPCWPWRMSISGICQNTVMSYFPLKIKYIAYHSAVWEGKGKRGVRGNNIMTF